MDDEYSSHEDYHEFDDSPEFMEFHTAPSSRVSSPLKSDSTGSVGEVYHSLDGRDRDDNDIVTPQGKLERDVENLEQEIEQLLHIEDAMKRDIELFRRDTHARIQTQTLNTTPKSPTPTPTLPITIPQPKRTPPSRPKLCIQNSASPPFSASSTTTMVTNPAIVVRPATPYRPCHPHPRRSSSCSCSSSTTCSPPTSSPYGSPSPPILTCHAVPCETNIRSQSQEELISQPPSQIPPQCTFQPSLQTPHQPTDIQTLTAAIEIIQTQLTLLDKGIKLNIANQLAALPASPTSGPDGSPVLVTDSGSLPYFKVAEEGGGEGVAGKEGSGKEGKERKERKEGSGKEGTDSVSRALLATVKVCCVLERGLEAVVGVLGKEEEDKGGVGVEESGEKEVRDGAKKEVDEWKKGEEGTQMDLMTTCLEKSKVVRREMRSALKGIEGVVKFDGTQQ